MNTNLLVFYSKNVLSVDGEKYGLVVQLLIHVRVGHCDSMDYSKTGFSVLHYRLEFAQICVH